MHTVDQQEQASHQPEMFIDSVSGTGNKSDQDFVDLKVIMIGRRPPYETSFKLDTGAQVNILTLKVYQQLGAWAGAHYTEPVQLQWGQASRHWTVQSTVPVQNMSPQVLHFYVVDTRCASVLGLQACFSLQLIQLLLSVEHQHLTNTSSTEELLDKYKDVFDGLGLFPGEYHLNIDPSVPPVVHASQCIALALKPKLKEELDNMVKDDVLVKLGVNDHSDWVNPLVVIEKPLTKKRRICLGPKDLNEVVKHEHYTMPTLDDIISKLAELSISVSLMHVQDTGR